MFVTRKLPPSVEARLSRDFDARLNADDRLLGREEVLAGAAEADALLICSTEKLDGAAVRALPAGLRILATFSVGTDHLDVAAARERGLIVTNTPEVLTDATAEIAMLCLLGAARRAWEAQSLVRSGEWTLWSPTALLGVQLTGKRLGILGMGRIGRAVARRAAGFEMEIHYHNRRRLPPDLEAGAIYHDSLEGLLAVSQFLSINCPGSAENARLLNAETIGRLPDGAVLVNTARGNIVDDEALIAALRSGKLRAAGLDVYAGEPNLNPAYLDLPNAFLLPHIGSATEETRAAMGHRCVDNIEAVLAGRRPLTPVA